MLSSRNLFTGSRKYLSSVMGRRFVTTDGAAKPQSGHAQFYSDTLPAMIPVFLLGSAVYLVCSNPWRYLNSHVTHRLLLVIFLFLV